MNDLSITFGPVMCFAEHLAVFFVCSPAFALGRNMVGIHLFMLVDACFIGFVVNGAEWTEATRYPKG